MKKIIIIVVSAIVIASIIFGIVFSVLKSKNKSNTNENSEKSNVISSNETSKGNSERLYKNTEYFWENKANLGNLYWTGSSNYKKYMLQNSNDYMTIVQKGDQNNELVTWKPVFSWLYNNKTTDHIDDYLLWSAVCSCSKRNSDENDQIYVYCNFDKANRIYNGKSYYKTVLDELSKECTDMKADRNNDYKADDGYPLVISGLEKTTVNNKEINYIRAQWKTTIQDRSVVRDANRQVVVDENNEIVFKVNAEHILYRQEYYAIMEFDLPDGEKGFIKMTIKDSAVDQNDLVDDSIINNAYQGIVLNNLK